MSFRTMLIVVLALVAGISAALGMNTLVNRGPSETTVETVPVVVAVTDIGRFRTLTLDLVKIRNFPKDVVPPGALTRVEDVLERGLVMPVVQGEAVLESKLGPKGAGRGIAWAVPEGMRACAVQTHNVAAGVAGFILPGSKVDVLLTLTGSGSAADATGGASTFLLLENVEILAVYQHTEAPGANKVNPTESQLVTLLVTPEQASDLNLAQSKGTLHLSLRNQNDSGHIVQRRRDLAELLGQPGMRREPPPAPAPAPAPAPVVVQKPPEPPPQPEPLPPGRIVILRGVGQSESVVPASPADEAANSPKARKGN